MSRKRNLYLGRAGQLAVMAEFLIRGWNVAIPEVDTGDDIFVVQDSSGDLSRIQVKTANGQSLSEGGFSAQFFVSKSQLETPRTPDLHYVFLVRYEEKWNSFLIINRADLWSKREEDDMGSQSGDGIVFRFIYNDEGTTCSGKDIGKYINNWERWPILDH